MLRKTFRELSAELTEGERMTIKLAKTKSYAGSFRHATRAIVSLRLSHARALTPHRGVIHYPRVASLPLGGRLFANLIITQIGRENKFSAENYVCP